MKLVFMGTGTSQGVPVIGYDSSGIDLSNPRNWRTRSCAHLYAGGREIQIDAGPEFRLQCLKNSVSRADAFILTHGHADHIAGMDDLRRFCDSAEGNAIDVYSNEYGWSAYARCSRTRSARGRRSAAIRASASDPCPKSWTWAAG